MTRNDTSTELMPEHGELSAAAELRELRALVEQSNLGIWHWDLQSGRVFYSEAWKRQLGCTDLPLHEDISEWEKRLHPQDRERLLSSLRAFIEQPWPNWQAELRLRHTDGSYRDVLMHLHAELDGLGVAQRVSASQLEVTHEKRLARELAQRAPERDAVLARVEQMLDAVPHMIAVMDLRGGLEYANHAWRAFYGQDIRRVTRAERMAMIHPDDRAAGVELQKTVWAELERKGGPALAQFGPLMLRLADAGSSHRWFSIQSSVVRSDSGQPQFILSTATDVHALKQSEEHLSEAQARLQAALRAGGIGLLVWEDGERRLRWDDSLQNLIGRTRDELEALASHQLVELVHEDDRQLVHAAGLRALQHGEALELECRVLRPDGALVSLAVKGRAERTSPSQPARMIAAVVDVTHRKQLEADVLQAQKMDAIGQLAGGIAHDFNNLLTIILGQLSLLQLEPDLPVHAQDSVHDIDHAARRAAELTRQLLTFARRQLMQTRTVDLNEAVAETLKLLRRIVGDAVSLELTAAREPVIARVDTTMLSQLLLALSMNARDAMERGGVCSFRTGIVDLDESACLHIDGAKPGRWAALTVSDTGHGIAPEVLPRVFEPFFTTKALGHGTGLGLSTVYGILKQHGGFVHVESELDRGTTFHAYLPWAGRDGASEPPRALEAERPRAARVSILLVEDEPAVRSLTRAVLEQVGHRVTVAENAPDALRVWRVERGDFDLLLTDMTMPGGMTGLELIGVLRKDKPGLRAILCSGYSLDLVLSDAVDAGAVALLQKPWTAAALHRCVAGVLDA